MGHKHPHDEDNDVGLKHPLEGDTSRTCTTKTTWASSTCKMKTMWATSTRVARTTWAISTHSRTTPPAPAR